MAGKTGVSSSFNASQGIETIEKLLKTMINNSNGLGSNNTINTTINMKVKGAKDLEKIKEDLTEIIRLQGNKNVLQYVKNQEESIKSLSKAYKDYHKVATDFQNKKDGVTVEQVRNKAVNLSRQAGVHQSMYGNMEGVDKKVIEALTAISKQNGLKDGQAEFTAANLDAIVEHVKSLKIQYPEADFSKLQGSIDEMYRSISASTYTLEEDLTGVITKVTEVEKVTKEKLNEIATELQDSTPFTDFIKNFDTMISKFGQSAFGNFGLDFVKMLGDPSAKAEDFVDILNQINERYNVLSRNLNADQREQFKILDFDQQQTVMKSLTDYENNVKKLRENEKYQQLNVYESSQNQYKEQKTGEFLKQLRGVKPNDEDIDKILKKNKNLTKEQKEQVVNALKLKNAFEQQKEALDNATSQTGNTKEFQSQLDSAKKMVSARERYNELVEKLKNQGIKLDIIPSLDTDPIKQLLNDVNKAINEKLNEKISEEQARWQTPLAKKANTQFNNKNNVMTGNGNGSVVGGTNPNYNSFDDEMIEKYGDAWKKLSGYIRFAHEAEEQFNETVIHGLNNDDGFELEEFLTLYKEMEHLGKDISEDATNLYNEIIKDPKWVDQLQACMPLVEQLPQMLKEVDLNNINSHNSTYLNQAPKWEFDIDEEIPEEIEKAENSVNAFAETLDKLDSKFKDVKQYALSAEEAIEKFNELDQKTGTLSKDESRDYVLYAERIDALRNNNVDIGDFEYTQEQIDKLQNAEHKATVSGKFDMEQLKNSVDEVTDAHVKLAEEYRTQPKPAVAEAAHEEAEAAERATEEIEKEASAVEDVNNGAKGLSVTLEQINEVLSPIATNINSINDAISGLDLSGIKEQLETIADKKFVTKEDLSALKELHTLLKEIAVEIGILDVGSIVPSGMKRESFNSFYDELDIIKEWQKKVKETDSYIQEGNELIEERMLLFKNGQQYGDEIVSKGKSSTLNFKPGKSDSLVHTHGYNSEVNNLRFSLGDIDTIVAEQFNRAFLLCGEEIIGVDMSGVKNENKSALKQALVTMYRSVYAMFGAKFEDGKITKEAIEELPKDIQNQAVDIINSMMTNIMATYGAQVTFTNIHGDDRNAIRNPQVPAEVKKRLRDFNSSVSSDNDQSRQKSIEEMQAKYGSLDLNKVGQSSEVLNINLGETEKLLNSILEIVKKLVNTEEEITPISEEISNPEVDAEIQKLQKLNDVLLRYYELDKEIDQAETTKEENKLNRQLEAANEEINQLSASYTNLLVRMNDGSVQIFDVESLARSGEFEDVFAEILSKKKDISQIKMLNDEEYEKEVNSLNSLADKLDVFRNKNNDQLTHYYSGSGLDANKDFESDIRQINKLVEELQQNDHIEIFDPSFEEEGKKAVDILREAVQLLENVKSGNVKLNMADQYKAVMKDCYESAREMDNGAVSDLLFGEDGELKSKDQLLKEIEEDYHRITAEMNKAHEAGKQFSNEEYTNAYASVLDKFGAAHSFGMLNYKDIESINTNKMWDEQFFKQIFESSKSADITTSLPDDFFSVVGIARDTRKELDKILNETNNLSNTTTQLVEQQDEVQSELTETDGILKKILYHYGLLSSYQGGSKSHQFGDEIVSYTEGMRNDGRGWADGTGTYVTDEVSKLGSITPTDFKKFFAIDASKIKMYEAHIEEEAQSFYEFQHKLEQFALASGSGFSGFEDNLKNVDAKSLYNEAKNIFSKYPEIFNSVFKDFESFENFINEMINLVKESGLKSDGSYNAKKLFEFKKNNGIDDIKTRFMKKLGFGGIDMSGTSYGGLQSGSVIYDIDTAPIIASGNKIEDVLQNIKGEAKETEEANSSISSSVKEEQQAVENAANSESKSLGKITDTLKDVITAIENKTDKFKEEDVVVESVVSNEIGNLNRLIGKIQEVQIQVEALSRDLKSLPSIDIKVEKITLDENIAKTLGEITESLAKIGGDNKALAALSGLSVGKNVGGNLVNLATGLLNVAEALKEIDTSKLDVFDKIKDLAGLSNIKEVATALSASVKQIKEVTAAVVTDDTPKKTTTQRTNELYGEQTVYQKEILRLTKQIAYASEEGTEKIQKQIDAYQEKINASHELVVAEKLTNQAKEASLNIIRDQIREQQELNEVKKQELAENEEYISNNSIDLNKLFGDTDVSSVMASVGDGSVWDRAIQAAYKYRKVLGDVLDVKRNIRKSGNDYLESYVLTGKDGNKITVGRDGTYLNSSAIVVDDLTQQKEAEKQAKANAKKKEADAKRLYQEILKWRKREIAALGRATQGSEDEQEWNAVLRKRYNSKVNTRMDTFKNRGYKLTNEQEQELKFLEEERARRQKSNDTIRQKAKDAEEAKALLAVEKQLAEEEAAAEKRRQQRINKFKQEANAAKQAAYKDNSAKFLEQQKQEYDKLNVVVKRYIELKKREASGKATAGELENLQKVEELVYRINDELENSVLYNPSLARNALKPLDNLDYALEDIETQKQKERQAEVQKIIQERANAAMKEELDITEEILKLKNQIAASDKNNPYVLIQNVELQKQIDLLTEKANKQKESFDFYATAEDQQKRINEQAELELKYQQELETQLKKNNQVRHQAEIDAANNVVQQDDEYRRNRNVAGEQFPEKKYSGLFNTYKDDLSIQMDSVVSKLNEMKAAEKEVNYLMGQAAKYPDVYNKELAEAQANLKRIRTEWKAIGVNSIVKNGYYDDAEIQKVVDGEKEILALRRKRHALYQDSENKEYANAVSTLEKATKVSGRYYELKAKAGSDKKDIKLIGKEITEYETLCKVMQEATEILQKYSDEKNLNATNSSSKYVKDAIADYNANSMNGYISYIQKSINTAQKRIKDLSMNPHNLEYSQEFIDKTKELENALNRLKQYQNLDPIDMQNSITKIEQARADVEKLDAELRVMKKDGKYILASESDVADELKRVEKLLAKNTRMTREMEQAFKAARDRLKEMLTPEGRGLDIELEKIHTNVSKVESEMIAAGKTGRNMFDLISMKARQATASAISMYFSFYDWIRYIREAVTAVTELDTALTEMRKVSNESLQSLQKYQAASFDIAAQVGTTAEQLDQSTADWMRIGESLTQATKDAQQSNILLNVSEFEDISSATDALVSMTQAYKELDSNEIVDVVNNLGKILAQTYSNVWGYVIYPSRQLYR